MRTLALLILLAPVADAIGPGRYVTQLGQRVLALSDLVAIGEVDAVNPPFRGVTTANFNEKTRHWLDYLDLYVLETFFRTRGGI